MRSDPPRLLLVLAALIGGVALFVVQAVSCGDTRVVAPTLTTAPTTARPADRLGQYLVGSLIVTDSLTTVAGMMNSLSQDVYLNFEPEWLADLADQQATVAGAQRKLAALHPPPEYPEYQEAHDLLVLYVDELAVALELVLRGNDESNADLVMEGLDHYKRARELAKASADAVPD